MRYFILFLSFFTSIFFNVSTDLNVFNLSEKNKEIYLTFDDGPSTNVTSEILDILKEEDVKGTFFVVGKEIKGREDILKRIYEEGHSLGLHSFTHERNNLYNDNNKFLKEMLTTQELIYKTVGIKPTALRFPFGCNNNTYKLKESLVDLLHKNNLKIYDWNVDSKDGEFYNANESLFIKNSKSKKDSIILLMHSGTANKNSPKALKEIIKYYKDNNYNFKTINSNTKELYHYIK